MSVRDMFTRFGSGERSELMQQRVVAYVSNWQHSHANKAVSVHAPGARYALKLSRCVHRIETSIESSIFHFRFGF